MCFLEKQTWLLWSFCHFKLSFTFTQSWPALTFWGEDFFFYVERSSRFPLLLLTRKEQTPRSVSIVLRQPHYVKYFPCIATCRWRGLSSRGKKGRYIPARYCTIEAISFSGSYKCSAAERINWHVQGYRSERSRTFHSAERSYVHVY